MYFNIIEINILFILNLDLLSAPCNFQGFEVNILNIPFVVNCGRGRKREYIGKALRDALWKRQIGIGCDRQGEYRASQPRVETRLPL